MFFAGPLSAFAITIITGMFLGVLFDFYRSIQRLSKPRKIVTSIADLLYWLVATMVVFASLLLSNWGEIRLYTVIGLLSGVLFYYRFLSAIITKFWLLAFHGLGQVIKFINRIIYYVFCPLLFLLKLFNKPVTYIRQKIITKQLPKDDIIPPK